MTTSQSSKEGVQDYKLLATRKRLKLRTWTVSSTLNRSLARERCSLTTVTWLYYGLICTTHWGDVFLNVPRWSVIGFQLITVSDSVCCSLMTKGELLYKDIAYLNFASTILHMIFFWYICSTNKRLLVVSSLLDRRLVGVDNYLYNPDGSYWAPIANIFSLIK